MKKKKYQCQQCDYKFELNVLESEKERQEWERRNKCLARPPRCKKCDSYNIIEI